MTPLHELATILQKLFPNARIDVAEPAVQGGFGFLDVTLNDHTFAVQWQEKTGFGVSSPEGHGYGEASDEVYPTVDDAANRITVLLRAGKKTEAPLRVRLRELRTERRMTQVELAEILHVTQPAVSQLERRLGRMYVGTLKMVVQAMGGTLVIQALFPDGVVRQIVSDEEDVMES